MSVRVLLVRHGRTGWNADGRIQGQADPPLDELGLQQAEAIADRLKDVALAAIVSSPLQRARVTAEAIAARHAQVPLVLDDRLKEYDFGVVSGLTWDEVVQNHPGFARRWPDDGWAVPIERSEGRSAFRDRVVAAMKEAVRSQADRPIAIVAHGGTFAVYLTTLLGLDINRRHPFHFTNASLSIVEVGDKLKAIDVLNDTCHLDGLRGHT
jgi:broad specificity phosphatase PhoE